MVLRPSPFQQQQHRRRHRFITKNSSSREEEKRRRLLLKVAVCIIITILIGLKLLFLGGSGDLQNYTLLLPSSSSSSSSESFQQLLLYNNDDETTTAVVKQQQQQESKSKLKSNLPPPPPVVIQKGGKEKTATSGQKGGGDEKDNNSIIPPKIILPEACRRRITQLSSNNPTIIGHHPTTTSQSQQPPVLQKRFFKNILTTDDIPSEYIHNQPFQNYKPMSLTMFDNITLQINYKVKVPFEESLPTNITMICIPDGIVVDNGIAGPYNYRRRPVNSNNNVSSSLSPINNIDDDDDPDPINIYQSKDWFPTNINGFINKRPTVIDIPGLGIQLSGWTGFTHNHWPLDTLIRLGLVYDALTQSNDDDPLWRNAKIVVSSNNNLKKNQLMTPSQKDFYERSNGIVVDPPISWLYDKLNLTHRLISNNGWLAKANTTIRFDLLLLPDITPQPKCGGNPRVKDPIFPRGTLLPIQKALGLTKTKEPKYIVFSSRENARRRSVETNHRKLIIYNLEKMLIDMNLFEGFKVIEWIYTNPQERYDIMKQTLVTIGVHGANLWNVAFMPPNGLLIEYNSYETEFIQKDCRTCGYSLANAASLEYALVETPGFHYDKTNFYPPINDTIEIIKSFLINKINTYNNIN